MSRSAITAAAFALTAGIPCDARTMMHVDPAPDARGRRLLLSVEPLEPSARGFELAALALATLREGFAAAPALPPPAALARAFAAANAALVAENRPLTGCRWERRVYVGATAVVIAGRSLTIARVPGSQVVVVQDRRLYAFPALASWCPDFIPTSDQPEPEPLGCEEETSPLLYHSVAAAGDLVLLCSSGVARHLARDAAAGVCPTPEILLRGDLDAVLDRLGEVAAVHDLDDAFAAGVVVDRLPAPLATPRVTHGGIGRLSAGWAATPRLAIQGIGSRSRQSLPVGAAGFTATAGIFAGAERWTGVGVPLTPMPTSAARRGPGAQAVPAVGGVVPTASPRDVALDHRPAAPTVDPRSTSADLFTWLRLLLVSLCERLLPRRRSVAVPLVARRHVLFAPGAGSIHRYTTQTTIPAEWRTNLPRGPEVHAPSRMMTVVLLLFLVFGGSGFAVNWHQDKTARVDAALTTFDQQLQVASSGARGATALAHAEVALREARQAGAPASKLGARQYAIDTTRDRLLGTSRLSATTRLGALPAGLTGRPVRLVRVDHEVYLVGGALYQLDADGHRLVELLAPGASVGGGPVGQLETAAADVGGIVASDGTALYARDLAGSWTRRPLGLDDGMTAWPAMPAAAFRGNFYGLAADGRVLKFPADDIGTSPLAWADPAANPDLAQARDVAIDGNVQVLLTDGRVLSFYQGTLQTTIAPSISPPLSAPVALEGGPDEDFLYLIDPGVKIGSTEGRIVRLNAAGGTGGAVQILPPIPMGNDPVAMRAACALADARDFVVDEKAGLVYFVTDRDLWRATLPASPDAATV
jgi:hypothetical protein